MTSQRATMIKFPSLLAVGTIAMGLFASAATAVDLTVSAIEVTQGFQASGNTTALVGFNPTSIRVKVALNGQTTPQPGVDALVRVYSNGVEIAGSPLYSTNGPISAPVAPNSANLNDTLNFYFVPPVGTDVDFVVAVNPFRTIVETSYANNGGSVLNRNFQCRKIVELAYVPINYTLGGGLPSASMIQPGNGDNFLRGIYRVRDWNYHRSPLGNLNWTTDVNASSTTLLNTLNDIRQNQIPAAGYTRPEFIYGWLLGNPYSGNGVAIGIPGAAAFGNTQLSKYQRTFAHELGHLWGQQHNTTTIGTVAFDVENHLRDPLSLPQPMPTTKKDIMYAGLDTIEAWVNQTTYLDAINDSRSACTAASGEGDGGAGGASDAGQPAIRFAGTHDHAQRRITMQPAFDLVSGIIDVDDPTGNVWVEAYDKDGVLIHALRKDTARCRTQCDAQCTAHSKTSFYAVLPRFEDEGEIASVTLREVRTGEVLAELDRSTHAPVVASLTIAPMNLVIGKPRGTVDVLVDQVELQWNASDRDGDALVANLLYSPDGGDAWFAIALDDASGSITFDAASLPQSRAQAGKFRLRVSDGFNTTDAEFPQGFSVGGGVPPDVHLLSPNSGAVVAQGSSVIFHASAWDMEDQYFNDGGVTWTSSMDGALGTGRVLAKRNLSVGTHTMTLRGTDASGLFTEVVFSFVVTARDFNTGDLDVDGFTNAADLAILLSSWNGNGLADLTLDGAVNADDLAILLSRWDN